MHPVIRFLFGIFMVFGSVMSGVTGEACAGFPVPEEAPTGFDGQTNGLTTQAQFQSDQEVFVKQENIADGLGPVYNAQSCGECHQNPVSGSSSQITELRAGQFSGQEQTGGSLVHSRAI